MGPYMGVIIQSKNVETPYSASAEMFSVWRISFETFFIFF